MFKDTKEICEIIILTQKPEMSLTLSSAVDSAPRYSSADMLDGKKCVNVENIER